MVAQVDGRSLGVRGGAFIDTIFNCVKYTSSPVFRCDCMHITMQCGQACSVVRHAVWSGIQCGQACMHCGQAPSVARRALWADGQTLRDKWSATNTECRSDLAASE